MTSPQPPAEQMTLTGRVLDPAGKPVAEAAVMVIVRSKYASRPQLDAAATGVMSSHEGRCDGSGQFRIELPRTTSARQHGLTLIAMAPGHGCGWTDLDPDADPPVADVALRPELIVRGRMFDVQGQPARGVGAADRVSDSGRARDAVRIDLPAGPRRASPARFRRLARARDQQ